MYKQAQEWSSRRVSIVDSGQHATAERLEASTLLTGYINASDWRRWGAMRGRTKIGVIFPVVPFFERSTPAFESTDTEPVR